MFCKECRGVNADITEENVHEDADKEIKFDFEHNLN